MKIVFVSNYLSHHQRPFSDAMDAITNHNYYFIETKPMKEERRALGWGDAEPLPYVINNYKNDDNQEKCDELIETADVVIIGSAPLKMVKNRLKAGKLTFMYSERIYKEGDRLYKLPKRLVSMYLNYGRFKNFYLLCASAYASADYGRTGTFKDKSFIWGYFPEVKKFENINGIISQKEKNSILWAGRFLDWKHPEMPVLIAERLRDEGYSFRLDMIGTGEKFSEIEKLIEEKNLQEYISLIGAVKPNEVRTAMEESEIFLFTSDFNEGWGVVLNEAMNSACACVASHAVGSAPFLIDDGKNGFLFENENVENAYEKVKYLIENTEERRTISKNAYEKITNDWLPEIACGKLIELSEYLLSNGERRNLQLSGLCSRAESLPNDWYKSNKQKQI